MPNKQNIRRIKSSDIDVPSNFLEQCKTNNRNNEVNVEVGEPKVEDLNDGVLNRAKDLCNNDDTFRQLFKGDTSGYKSRSEAEFAFVIKMLSLSFEPNEINKIMFASGMTKWSEESDVYREHTIEEAVSRFEGTKTKDRFNGSYNFSRFDSDSNDL